MKNNIEIINIETNSGYVSSFSKTLLSKFLSEAEINELNKIGYSGKNSAGNKVTQEKYLNS